MRVHDQKVPYPHWQHKARIPWLPSCHHLHLYEPCYCYTKEHGIEQAAMVSLSGPPLKDQPM